MTGTDKFEEVGKRLKAEVEEKKAKEEANKQVALNQLSAIKNNPELQQFFAESAKVGAENLSGNAPYLKVHAAGKSTTNFLANGQKPNDGWLFYAPTQEQFETVTCHILATSRGFKADGMNEGNGQKKEIFNQLIGGVIVGEGEDKPFIMYLTGVKLNPMWEFGKEASRWVKSGIPMFALTVKLSTVEIKTKFGFAWTLKFEIEKDEKGFPVLVTDLGQLQYLKDSALLTQETMADLVAAKSAKVDEDIKPLYEEDESFSGEPTPF